MNLGEGGGGGRGGGGGDQISSEAVLRWASERWICDPPV